MRKIVRLWGNESTFSVNKVTFMGKSPQFEIKKNTFFWHKKYNHEIKSQDYEGISQDFTIKNVASLQGGQKQQKYRFATLEYFKKRWNCKYLTKSGLYSSKWVFWFDCWMRTISQKPWMSQKTNNEKSIFW